MKSKTGKKYLLGIDCGTQSTKVIVYDPAARRVLARGQAPHALISKADGTREQKADWWLQALKKAVLSISKNVRGSIGAIGVSGQQHGFVPVDAGGNVLRAVKLWCDTSTAAECEELTAGFGGARRLLARAGNLIVPGYTASKILWLKKNHPALYAKMATVLLPHDYLNYYLTGNRTMELGDASGTGLLNIRTRQWEQELVRLLDGSGELLKKLPALSEASRPAGKLTKKAAEALGLPEGAVVSSGGGDNMMGAIGTGTNRDGALTVSLGTSGTIYGYSSAPLIDPGGNLAAFCSSTGGWLPLLCTMNCTVATELARDLFRKDLTEMEKLAASVAPGSDGVLLLPFFNGERTPNLPKGRGSIVGLTASNYTQAHLLRASMESGIYGLKLGLESFIGLGFRPKQISLIGGGSKSRLWRQMAADIFELPVVCPVEEEAAAFGAALQALWCLRDQEGKKTGLNGILAEHVRSDPKKRHRPQARAVRLYRGSYQRYKAYVAAVSPLFR